MRALYNGTAQTCKSALRFDPRESFVDVNRERAINRRLIRRAASWTCCGNGETEKLGKFVEILFELRYAIFKSTTSNIHAIHKKHVISSQVFDPFLQFL